MGHDCHDNVLADEKDEGRMKELLYTFTSSTGEDEIRVRGWIPENVRGVIQYHHGVTSHIDKSEELAHWFANRGFAFVGLDCLGHGRIAFDAGHLGWFAREHGWSHLVRDFGNLYEQVDERFSGVPHFVYGNSMGSFVVRTMMICYEGIKPAGVVLAASSMNSEKILSESYELVDNLLKDGKDPYKGTGKIQHFAFGTYCERIENPQTPFDWVCRDNERMKKTPDDYSMFMLSPSIFKDMTDGQIFNSDPQNIAKMRKDVPYYIVSGKEDPAGNYGEGPTKLRDAFETAGIENVELHLWDNVRHELFMDIDGELIMGDILRWMNEII